MTSREGTTQGDPLAMAMYAIGTQPLIHRLNGIAKQVWYADDSAAGSSLERLRRWWDLLEEIGPHYGYFPNGSKTYIVAKPEVAETAKEVFQGTGISISLRRGEATWEERLAPHHFRTSSSTGRLESGLRRSGHSVRLPEQSHMQPLPPLHMASPPDGTTSYGSWI